MSKTIALIAEVVKNGVTHKSLLGEELLTQKEALEIANDVLGGYDGGPKLAEPPEMYLIVGEKIPLTIKEGEKTAIIEKKKKAKTI